VTIPAVIVTIIVASMVAFAVSRFSWRFNLVILLIFTAGNLLPPQVIIVPLFKLYNALRGVPPPLSDNSLLYDQYFGVFLINFVFQLGFCIFVLSNYMKTISKEITESAIVDGAHVLRIWWSIVLPLCRPALAAMATLLFTFIYNDFFWALLLMKSGDRRPITSALNNLQGQFVTDTNVLAAGALLAAIPTILVYIALQRHFISGLTLGSTKG
jgi:multiple sugar transport system permease protein